MSFRARCPFCQREALAPDDDLGRSVRCHGCGDEFVLVPELSTGAAFARTPAGEPAVEPEPETGDLLTAAPPRTDARREPEYAASVTDELPPPSAADDEPGSALASWVLAGIACACAALAGVSGSVTSMTGLLVPFALAGLLTGVLAVGSFLGRATPLELAVPGVAAGGSAILLLLALFAPDYLSPQYEASRQRSKYDPDELRYLPITGELVDPATLVPADGWADARRVACQQGGVRIEVASASVGPVVLAGRHPPYSKERYLTIGLRVQHVGHGGAVPFAGWGATAPRTVPDAKLTVGGKTTGQAAPGGRVVGAIYEGQELTPSSSTDAKLVFDVPPPGQSLRLELPAEAWNGRGAFRFAIPAAMVTVAPVPKAK